MDDHIQTSTLPMREFRYSSRTLFFPYPYFAEVEADLSHAISLILRRGSVRLYIF